jgi:dihydroorotase
MAIDLLIKNGRLIDPASGIDEVADLAISAGEVVEVGSGLPAAGVPEVIDATGALVTPGLIDSHTHLFRGADYLGIDADSIAWRSGVTTWLDAGSAGAFRLPAFREHVIERSEVTVRALINISYLGLPGMNYDEYCNPAACDVDLLERVVDSQRDVVVGIKTRMGREGVCNLGIYPLIKAVEASERTGLPIMCHISGSPPSIDAVLGKLRPGDTITHAFTGGGERLVDSRRRLKVAARRARDAGIRFDIGHGAGSFSFTSAEALAEQGFWPDSISTDLHQLSLPGPRLVEDQAQIVQVRGDGAPQLTLLTVMTKLLFLGMPLVEVIRATTATPAGMFGLAGCGSIRRGERADVAILELRPGPIDLFDVFGETRRYQQQLVCRQTILNGRPMVAREMPAAPPWIRMIDQESPAARTAPAQSS